MPFSRQDIIDSLTDDFILDMMEEFGASCVETQDNCYIFQTVCHGGTSHKLYYYPNADGSSEPAFHCYTECGQMSVFDLVSKVRGCDYHEALRYLGNKLGLTSTLFGFTGVSYEKPEPEEKATTYSISDYSSEKLPIYDAENLVKYFMYRTNDGWVTLWEAEGISRTTLLKYEIGYYEQIPMPYSGLEYGEFYIIPVRDIDGDLIGIRRRELPQIIDGVEYPPSNKYMPLRYQSVTYSFPTSKALYGIYQNQDAIRKAGYCVVFEGEKSVLKMDTYYGEYPCVAVYGSNLGFVQMRMLYDLGVRTIILAFDNDHPEDDNAQLSGSKWYQRNVELIPELKCDYMFDGYKDLLGKKDSPADKGREVFEELFKRRTRSEKADAVEE